MQFRLFWLRHPQKPRISGPPIFTKIRPTPPKKPNLYNFFPPIYTNRPHPPKHEFVFLSRFKSV